MPEGRVALVTGAGRGIGRATALLLARRGARVMAVSRTESELRTLAREAEIEILAESVATSEGCAQIIEATRRRLGPVEILVNNAGVGSAGEQPIWEQDPEHWHRTLATNLHGPFELTRLAARDMIEARFGRIVMVSSTAGEIGAPRMSAYCTSKHGLIGLMRAVAQDVGPYNVTCNAVLPGWVRTEMAERSAEREADRRGTSVADVWAERAADYPPGRVLEPEEVAAVIAFLVGGDAGGISGEAITVALGGLW
jgi:NAD(P)-dependent dehydrogenase (short-subunit alcohol dehydrogenase family)